MDFRILGPLEVWDGARAIPIRGRLHPKILAGLLLNNTRTVSLDWLVELLWDDDPPQTARRQAQNTVAALRRQATSGLGVLIQRSGQGYRIDAPNDAVDFWRFEMGAGKGRRLAENGEYAAAFDAFAEALELWRGPALDGMSGRVLEAAAARLNEARLAAFEDFAETALRTDRAGQILDDLRALAEANPLRQRLTARLIATLCRLHRGSEALRLFESIRDRLATSLGIDPSPELRDLHARMSRDDPTLTAPPASHRAEANLAVSHPVPAQLPAGISTFTGRADHVAALDGVLDDEDGMVSILSGIGGVGKSALAIQWGHMRRRHFPDGQLYVDLRGFGEGEPLSSHEALSRMLRALGVPAHAMPTDVNDAVTMYRAILKPRRVLIVLDDAFAAEQVLPLLPPDGGCRAVITSRNRLTSLVTHHHARPVLLESLSRGESIDLLVKLTGLHRPDDLYALETIADLCGHLPLAIRVAAGMLTGSGFASPAELARTLSSDSRLRLLQLEADRRTDITVVLDTSYQSLGDDERSLLGLLGLIPGHDFTIDLVAKLANLSMDDTRRITHNLESASLLDRADSTRYRLHDLVRVYAGEVAARHLRPEDRAEADDLLITWYGDKANVSFAEFENIVAVCRSLTGHPRLWELAPRFTQFANFGNDLPTARQSVLSIIDSSNVDFNVVARVQLRLSLGSIEWAAGNHSAAVSAIEHALPLIPRLDDLELKGTVIGNLGNALLADGQYDEAERRLRQALDIAVAIGNRAHQHSRAHNLGSTYRALGRYPESEAQYLRARAIAVEDSMRDRLAGTQASLGVLYARMGRFDEARSVAHEAYVIATHLNMNRQKMIALHVLSDVSCAFGQFSEAESQLGEAEALAIDSHRLESLIDVRCRQAKLHLANGRYAEGVSLLRSTRAIAAESFSEAVFDGEIVQILCALHNALSDYSQARGMGAIAVAAFRDANRDPLQLARSLDCLGDAYEGLGDDAAACGHWTEALEIFTRLGVPEADAPREKLRLNKTSR